MRLLFLEPFFGGSHLEFARGLKEHSSHDIQIVSLPATYWKWRMAGAAFEFLQMIKNLNSYDGIIATDMMNLSDFIMHASGNIPPVLLYFHENQLSYPISEYEKTDHFMGAVNISSALAAKKVLFNSRFHYTAFFDGVKTFLAKMPDMDPSWILDRIQSKSDVLYPGCRLHSLDRGPEPSRKTEPLVVWNHRWEYDKNPDAFFAALKRIKQKRIPFSLALLGESHENIPASFVDAKKEFNGHLKVYGYVESREEYRSWLKKGTIVVSTSNQENFGISVVEAVCSGCIPLVPSRLSYPEIIPEIFHESCLYTSQRDLISKLEIMLQQPEKYVELSIQLSEAMKRYSWETMSKEYDRQLEALIK